MLEKFFRIGRVDLILGGHIKEDKLVDKPFLYEIIKEFDKGQFNIDIVCIKLARELSKKLETNIVNISVRVANGRDESAQIKIRREK